MSNKNEFKREVLASELGQLKDKYSQMEQTFNELKNSASQDQAQGLVQAQGPQSSELGQLKDTFYQEANIEVASELGQRKD